MLTRQALPREFLESAEWRRRALGEVRSMAEGEEALIRKAIADTGGNLTLAARQLGIARARCTRSCSATACRASSPTVGRPPKSESGQAALFPAQQDWR